MSESNDEKLSRLRSMALGGPTWDLSRNDQCAIQFALDEIERLQKRVTKEIEEFNAGYDHGANGGSIEDEPVDRITEDQWVIGFKAGSYERLHAIVERLPELIGIVATDCGATNEDRPSLYKRGNLWRYHVQRCGNEWADDADPIKAAEKARTP
jgi:hypothetical protein